MKLTSNTSNHERGAMERQRLNTSSLSRENKTGRPQSAPAPISEGEMNLCHYLKQMGLPSGVNSVIQSVYKSMESRIWIVDNSLDMTIKDCFATICDDKERIAKGDVTSRWSEQLRCLDFHIKMAARTWIPTMLWMTNRPKHDPQQHGICWGGPSTWTPERERATKELLRDLRPETPANPLAFEIRKVVKKLEPMAPLLEKKGKFVSVIICTQGVPSNERGEVSSAATKDYYASLKTLSDLPVKVVFRLCTSDKQVVRTYNKSVDIGIDCDVLCDYWQEAMEVHSNNPWITYGIGLHRIREAGLGTDVMDSLDEELLSLDELHKLCVEFFIGRGGKTMRHPAKDWKGFLTDLHGLLKHEKPVWNPMKKKMCPWVDIEVLNRVYRRK